MCCQVVGVERIMLIRWNPSLLALDCVHGVVWFVSGALLPSVAASY